MQRKIGKAVGGRDGYAIHECYVKGESGEYIFVGFAVLSPDGELLGAFATLEAAEQAVEELLNPDPSDLLGM